MTTAFPPYQNDGAERLNRTIVSSVRSMLEQKGLPKCLRAEALSTVVYIRNCVTSNALPSKSSPHHIWYGHAPVLAHLRVFGCKCWYTVPKGNFRNLDARGRLAIFVGYSEQSKEYKWIDAETKKVAVTKDMNLLSQARLTWTSGQKQLALTHQIMRKRKYGLDIRRVLGSSSRAAEVYSQDKNVDTSMSSGDPGENDRCTFKNIGAGSATTSELVRRFKRRTRPPRKW